MSVVQHFKHLSQYHENNPLMVSDTFFIHMYTLKRSFSIEVVFLDYDL